MSKFVEFTLAQVSEPITVNLDKIVLIEQKPLNAGGYVNVFLEGGKEFMITESYENATKAMKSAADTFVSLSSKKSA